MLRMAHPADMAIPECRDFSNQSELLLKGVHRASQQLAAE